jgi:ABC-type transport system involved in cytochrome c biogenesis permease component
MVFERLMFTMKKDTFFYVVLVVLLVDTYLKFSTGTYAMTGAGFKTGAMLMPLILVLIFGKNLYEKVRS